MDETQGRQGQEQSAGGGATHHSARKPARGHRTRKSTIRETTLIILIPALIVALIRFFLIGIYVIPSGSMENTLMIGDRIVTSKLDGKITPLQRGDIIVFKDPDHWLTMQQDDALGGGYLVKRLIGLPGDHVACCDATGDITINGVPITEPYVKPGDPPSLIPFNVTVTPGNLFVLGDNRSNSADSRYHLNDGNDGLVPVSDVVGVVKLVYWPFNRWKWISRPASVFAKVSGISGVYE